MTTGFEVLSTGFEILSAEFEILLTTSDPFKPIKYKDWKFCPQNFQLEVLSTEFEILSD